MITPQVIFQKENESLFIYRAFAADWLSPHHIERFLEKEGVALKQNKITVFGKEYNEPRLTYWMGPAYRYSSVYWLETAFTEEIARWKNTLTQLLHFSFNSVLINYYRDGQDGMGKHRDNEPEMDSHCIASLSFGASREIHFEQPTTKQKVKVALHHGDLLVMNNFQDTWWHSVPKRKNVSHSRLNLTFRKISSAPTSLSSH